MNFNDPHGYLYSDDFRELVVNMVDVLELGPTTNLDGTVRAVIAKWVHDVYQLSGVMFQRFIAYIIDLTLVLQTLYLVSDSQELSRRAIKLTVASYYTSPSSREVHNRIQGYGRKLTLLELADRDSLDKIMELAELYRIDAKEISTNRALIPTVDSVPDEPW
ncbi:hypothetical protein BDR03DRAFT_966493, partial [Suillus americanus]